MKWWNDEISLMNKFEKKSLFKFRDQNNITEENNCSGGFELQRWADNVTFSELRECSKKQDFTSTTVISIKIRKVHIIWILKPK